MSNPSRNKTADNFLTPEKHVFFVYLTCFYVFIWYLQLGDRFPFFAAIRFEFILGAILTFAAILTRQSLKIEPNNITKYIAWYFVALIIQIPLSANFDYSLNIFIDRVVKFSMIALFISTFIRDSVALKLLLAAYLLAAFRLSMEGFIGWKSGSLIWQNQGIMRLHGSITELAHPNSFSGFAVGLLPFIFYLFPVVKKPYKAFLAVLFLFTTIIIIYTGSRTGYVATAGFIAFFIYKSEHRAKAIALVMAILIVATPMIPDQYYERLESIFTQKDKEGNSSGKRLEIIEDAIYIFTSNPFGVGVAAFPTVREQVFGRKQDTHNLYLEILTNLGIQGFIVFILLISATLKNLKSNRQRLHNTLEMLTAKDNNEEQNDYGIRSKNIRLTIAVSQAVTAFIVVRLFLGLFGMDLYEVYWWLAIGLACAIQTIATKEFNAVNNST